MLVILTARHEEMDVVVGLEAGADDYLTKSGARRSSLALSEIIRPHLRRSLVKLRQAPSQIGRAHV